MSKSVGNDIEFYDERVLGTTLGDMDVPSLGTYNGTMIRSLEI